MEKRERANSQLRDGRGRECVNLREWILQRQKHRCRGWWAIMTGWGGCLIPGALERLHAAAGTLISAAFALQWRQRVSRGISPLYSRRHTGGERPIKLRNEQHIQRGEWRASPLARRSVIWRFRLFDILWERKSLNEKFSRLFFSKWHYNNSAGNQYSWKCLHWKWSNLETKVQKTSWK